MNLSSTLATAARAFPNRPAVTAPDLQLTYAGLEHHARHIAGSLRKRHGLQPGARVGIAMENCGAFLTTLYGIWRAGLTAVPMNAKLHAKEMAWILENADSRLVIVDDGTLDKLAGLGTDAGTLPPVISTSSRDFAALLEGDAVLESAAAPADEAWLFYTSGTTGRPKGAVLSHRNLLFMCHAYYADIDFIGPDDTILHAAPLSHGSGLYGIAFVAKAAHNVVLGGSFEPDRIFDALSQYANVSMFAAPTMVSRLINAPRAGATDTRTLKTITYGGAPMYVSDLKRAIELFGPKLFQLYGQGESPMTIAGLSQAFHADTAHPDWEARLGSTGIARTGVAIKVVDEAGHELPTGEIGEIITKSDCVMTGYWRNADANAKSLREGWLWTGDMGSLDESGFLTLKDRSKDMIISGGSNIYPREIEEVLLRHSDVREVAVVSRPHADWGEEVIAFVVAQHGATVDGPALDQLCLDNIARYKRPRGYRFVESLPKNNYGKILKTELRERLATEA